MEVVLFSRFTRRVRSRCFRDITVRAGVQRHGGLFDQDIATYVIDKAYFPTVESIKAAANVALLDPKPVAYKDGDRLIELRTVFILIPVDGPDNAMPSDRSGAGRTRVHSRL